MASIYRIQQVEISKIEISNWVCVSIIPLSIGVGLQRTIPILILVWKLSTVRYKENKTWATLFRESKMLKDRKEKHSCLFFHL